MNDWDFVTVTVEDKGSLEMPVAFASWLGDEGLVETFFDAWEMGGALGIHGNAFSRFAVANNAPAKVRRAIARAGDEDD